MSNAKFEDRLNRINASVTPVGTKTGGGSGSWKNGQSATGQEPRFDLLTGEEKGTAAPRSKPGLLARLSALFHRRS